MAVTFLDHTVPGTTSIRRADHGALPRPQRRPSLVMLEGGRSRNALERRRVFMVRRLAVLVLAALALVALVPAAAAVFDGAAAPTVAGGYDVNPGDTLWSIAGTVAGGADRREVVSLLADANGGTVVVPGQHLVIPPEVVSLAS